MDRTYEGALTIRTRPAARWEPYIWVVLAVVYLGYGFAGVVLILARVEARGPGFVSAVLLAGAFWTVSGPLVMLASHRSTPRGSWRIDAEGITYRSTRGVTLSLDWGDVEKVRWGLHPGVALVGGRTTLYVPLSLVAEPGRSEALARLEALLGSDFDLTRRTSPDALDGTEPAWFVTTLRVVRVVAVGSAFAAAFLGSLLLVSVRYPGRGAWQVMTLLLAWGVLGVALIWVDGRKERELNPTWRPRLVKRTKPDPLDDC